MHWDSQYCGSLCFSKDQGDGEPFFLNSATFFCVFQEIKLKICMFHKNDYFCHVV